MKAKSAVHKMEGRKNKMSNYANQIFDMLGVEPGEEFKIKGKNNVLPYLYKLTEKLETYSYDADDDRWRRLYTGEILKDVLNGTYKVVKIPRPTAEEQLAIDYARACGWKWMAKDKSKKVFAFKNKPIKADPQTDYNISGGGIWIDEDDGGGWMPIGIPISFLSWEDEEPYYIGD